MHSQFSSKIRSVWLRTFHQEQLTRKNKVLLDFPGKRKSGKKRRLFGWWFSFGPFSAVKKSYELIFLHVSDLVRNFRKSIEKRGSVTMTTMIISDKVNISSVTWNATQIFIIPWHDTNEIWFEVHNASSFIIAMSVFMWTVPFTHRA